jgi:hypothetical protein
LRLLQGAIAPADPNTPASWAETPAMTADELRAAMEKVREQPYVPSCGTHGHPHVFHPSEFYRLMGWEYWASYTGPVEWVQCANCGTPQPAFPDVLDE